MKPKDEIPRRIRMDLWTPAEKAIHAATQEVEKMGADEKLTDAVILLGEAKNKVADFVDGMMASVLKITPDYLIISWSKQGVGFGELTMQWNQETGKYILDSEHMGIETTLEILQAIKIPKTRNPF